MVKCESNGEKVQRACVPLPLIQATGLVIDENKVNVRGEYFGEAGVSSDVQWMES